jgi:Leucine-rich repeat (LRR) protein
MKKFLLLSATLLMSLVANADVQINETNFPDANFRNYLLAQSWGSDGVLTDQEVSEITSLEVSYRSISSLKGIEFFTALTYLDCGDNQLTSLDVSKNTALKFLYCYINQLTSLDVSKNTALKDLYCYTNQLTSLDVSKNTALTWLCCYNNQLTSLDVSNCTALTWLECYQNQIKGAGMDALVNSLPQKESASLYIYYPSNTEGNVCTTSHVGIAKQKGWKVLYNNGGWEEYAGSDPSGIQSVTLGKDTNTPIYDLNGTRLESPKKGINIIGGKKVVVK